MKSAFVALVVACLWGFASATPLAVAHNVSVLWVAAAVLVGSLFWGLAAVHVADAHALWRRRDLKVLVPVYDRIGWDAATFLALLVLFALMRGDLVRAGIGPQLLPWVAMALVTCAIRIVLVVLLGGTERHVRRAVLVALATCLVALWFACFAIAQLGMQRLSSVESIWFEVTSIVAGVAMYVGVKQLVDVLGSGSLRTTPSLAHTWGAFATVRTGSIGPAGSTGTRGGRKRQARSGRRRERR